jgi:hypothetical protein
MKTTRGPVGIFLVIASVSVAVWTELAQACAMCQTVMPRGGDPLARGLFLSMLILLAAPFVVSAAIGGWLYYCQRTARFTARVTPGTIVPLPEHPHHGESS